MNFSTDRDLLTIEPSLFTDIPLMGQQRLSVADGVLTGTTLTSATADFVAAQVESGSVLLLNGLAVEIVHRSDAHTLTVSLLRSSLSDAPIPPVAASALTLVARTFAPQAAVVHDMLLRLTGIEPDDSGSALSEESIVSLSVMARLESLGVLEMVYSAAASIVGDNRNLLQKAEHYRQAFAQAIRRATVMIDADGDGFADVRRSLGNVALHRV